MRSPGLGELPTPPPGKTGWPWTEASSAAPPAPPGRTEWPRITVVTPSYNQGRYIEETLRSVLLQAYPNLEYMVLDGGSTDESVEIIRKYAPWLSFWSSEKDRGQSDAINRGFRRGTGEIFAWLNSDDVYCPDALNTAGAEMCRASTAWLIGGCYVADSLDDPRREYVLKIRTRAQILDGCTFPQPSTFFRAELIAKAGLLDESLHYLMDYDLWCRFYQLGFSPEVVDVAFSLARNQPEMKTQPRNMPKMSAEARRVLRRNLGTAGLWWHDVRRIARRVRRKLGFKKEL